MAINRKSYSSTISPVEGAGMAKVIVSNLTGRGYLHLVTVRTTFDQQGNPTEHYIDALIHPDRALNVDVQKFDAVSLVGCSNRQSPGEPKANTQYVWAQDARAIGRHRVTRNAEGKLVMDGVDIYATATAMDPEQEAELEEQADAIEQGF